MGRAREFSSARILEERRAAASCPSSCLITFTRCPSCKQSPDETSPWRRARGVAVPTSRRLPVNVHIGRLAEQKCDGAKAVIASQAKCPFVILTLDVMLQLNYFKLTYLYLSYVNTNCWWKTVRSLSRSDLKRVCWYNFLTFVTNRSIFKLVLNTLGLSYICYH